MPDCAEGYKLLSVVTSHYVFMGFAENKTVLKQEAEQSIRKALSLTTNDEHVYWGLGIVLDILQERLDDAVIALQRSIEINPNFSLGYGTLGTVLAYGGRPQESIDRTNYAIRLNRKDPSLFFRYSVLSISYFLLADYEQSAKWARSTIERNREYCVPYAILAAASEMVSRPVEAKNAGMNLLRINPAFALDSMPIDPIRLPSQRAIFYEAFNESGLTGGQSPRR